MTQNALYYTIAKLLPPAVGFLLLPLYTRILTPAEYGIMSSLYSIQSIITLLITLGIDRANFRLSYDYSADEKDNYFATIGLVTISISLFLSVLLFFTLKHTCQFLFKDIPFYPLYPIFLTATLLDVFTVIPSTKFMIKGEGLKYLKFSSGRFILNVSLTAFFLLQLRLGVSGVFYASLIANALYVPVSIKMMFFRNKILTTQFVNIVKNALMFSIPMLPAFLSAWIINLSNRMVISKYYSLTDVGIFSFATKANQLLLILGGAITAAYTPMFYKWFAEHSPEFAIGQSSKYHTSIHKIIAFFVMIVILFIPELISIAGTSSYAAAKDTAILLSIGALFGQLASLFNLSLYQQKKTGLIAIITVITAVSNLGLNFLLVPRLGSVGAALTSVVTFISIYAINFQSAKKHLFIPVRWVALVPYILSIFIAIVITRLPVSPILLILKLSISSLFLYFLLSIDLGYKIKRKR